MWCQYLSGKGMAKFEKASKKYGVYINDLHVIVEDLKQRIHTKSEVELTMFEQGSKQYHQDKLLRTK